MRIYLIVYLCIIISNVILARVARIIGGEDADIEEFPYVASLRFFPENLHFCGGAIISTWHIVTAAHCVKHLYLSEFRVCVGSNNNTNSNPCYKIQQVAIHPQFFNRIVESKAGHDIAVVTVDGYIVFNEFQNKIDLPTEDIHPDEKCITVGWGWTSFPFGELFERLQKTDMKIVSNEECTNKYPLTILKHQVCAFQREGVGTCFGDSGGPLVSNDKLIGIASFVHPCAKGDPDVFTRVYSYLDFIQTSMQTTNNLMCCLPL